jgi:hypothetical protein
VTIAVGNWAFFFAGHDFSCRRVLLESGLKRESSGRAPAD